jgi:hypothetical protein
VPTFTVSGRLIHLPGFALPVKAGTDTSAWQSGRYLTIRLFAAMDAIRIHTDGKSFPGRPGSAAKGRWVAIGDIEQTSGELASSRSLPTRNPRSMVAFTHTGLVRIPARCVINIGLASAKFGGRGGAFQAEYVSGPRMTFVQLVAKHWHGRAGNA